MIFRFSKDKPYINIILVLGLLELSPLLRGGYYLHIEPGGSFVGGGFWEPNAVDLQRIENLKWMMPKLERLCRCYL